MRLIDADELIKHFKEFHEYYTEDNLKFDEDEIYSVIGEQPTVSEWISVKDRLPDEDGSYLTYLGFSDGGIAECNFDTDEGAFGWWSTEFDPVTYGYVESNFEEASAVSHWMPLLEGPPEVE